MASLETFEGIIKKLKTIQTQTVSIANTLLERCKECNTSTKSSIKSELLAINENIVKGLTTLQTTESAVTAITVNDVVEIMDEIDSESKNNDQSQTEDSSKIDPLSSLTENRDIVEKPVCVKNHLALPSIISLRPQYRNTAIYVEPNNRHNTYKSPRIQFKTLKIACDDKLKLKFWTQFCDEHDIVLYVERSHRARPVVCGKMQLSIKLEEFGSMEWHDYVNFRYNYIETELRNNLYNLCGNNKNSDVDYMMNQFNIHRFALGIIPSNRVVLDFPETPYEYLDKLDSFLEYYFNSSNDGISNNNNGNSDRNYGNINVYNIHPCLIYIIVWHSICQIYEIFNPGTYGTPSQDQVVEYLHEILLNTIPRSGIFGDFISDPEEFAWGWGQARSTPLSDKDAENAKENKARAKALNDLFGVGKQEEKHSDDVDNKEKNKKQKNKRNYDTDDKEIQQWLEYGCSDVGDMKVYSDRGQQRGMEYYLINRLTYAVFNDLIVHIKDVNTNGSNSNNKNEKQLKYPKLLKLFQFLYNFGVYCLCYPRKKGNKAESFYLKAYFYLRNACFENIFDNDDQEASMLTRFNYFDKDELRDGTILIRATVLDMLQYCSVLVNDGFSFTKFNRRSENLNAVKAAKKNRLLLHLSLFESRQGKEAPTKSDISQLNDNEIMRFYHMFKKQKAIAMYCLMILGCGAKNEEIKDIDHVMVAKGEWYSDSLYNNFGEYFGLHRDNVVLSDKKKAIGVMNNVMKVVMQSLKLKLPISDDLLILCVEFASQTKQLNNFMQALVSVCEECLDDSDHLEHFKAYNYTWFKHYLLNSSVWLCQITDDNEKDDDEENDESKDNNKDNKDVDNLIQSKYGTYYRPGDEYLSNMYDRYNQASKAKAKAPAKPEKEIKILYSVIESSALGKLEKQRKYIWDNVKKEEEKKVDGWKELVDFSSYQNSKYKDIRQDIIIPDCIEPSMGELELHLATLSMGNGENYDSLSQANTKQYLTKCLISAHAMNGEFQKVMKSVLKKYGLYQSAPVKLEDRCVIKAQTDYINKKYPSSANICDILRCSVTCDTPQMLLNAVNELTEQIKNGEIEGLVEVIRIKNGFENIKKWKNANDATYCDVKINIVFKDVNNTKVSMITEVQFLLKWLLHAKKLGHKYYNITRREDFMNRIKNDIYNIDTNYTNYKNKITIIVNKRDINGIAQELMVQPNLLLSIVWNGKPLLYYIGVADNFKIFELFLSGIFHFNKYILGNNNSRKDLTDSWGSNPKENCYIWKYLNFSKCKNDIIRESNFWGIDTNEMKQGSRQYKAIEYIMKCEYFDGMAQMGAQIVCENTFFYVLVSFFFALWFVVQRQRNNICGWILFASVGLESDYLSLILKYISKNKDVFYYGVNWREPLIKLLESENCNEKYLSILLQGSIKSERHIKSETLEKAIKMCKDDKLKSMIVKYQTDINNVRNDRSYF